LLDIKKLQLIMGCAVLLLWVPTYLPLGYHNVFSIRLMLFYVALGAGMLVISSKPKIDLCCSAKCGSIPENKSENRSELKEDGQKKKAE
jgi:hypothetical protein